MAEPYLDLSQGTLDLLILRTLALESQHGLVIANWILQASSEALHINQARLYPTLRRLERGGWISGRSAGNNGGTKYYALTQEGQKRLEEAAANRQQAAAIVAEPSESR